MSEAKRSSRARLSIRRAVSDALIEDGYRRKYGNHIRPLSGDVSTVVQTGPLDGYSDIVPWVGLRHEGVQRLTTQLMELADDGYDGTVGANVGVILGTGYRRWLDPNDVDEVMASIDQAIQVLTQYTSLDRLQDAWGFKGMVRPDPYRRVSTYMLMHDSGMFERALEEGRLQECEQEDEVCEQFRRFERNARARFGRDDHGA